MATNTVDMVKMNNPKANLVQKAALVRPENSLCIGICLMVMRKEGSCLGLKYTDGLALNWRANRLLDGAFSYCQRLQFTGSLRCR